MKPRSVVRLTLWLRRHCTVVESSRNPDSVGIECLPRIVDAPGWIRYRALDRRFLRSVPRTIEGGGDAGEDGHSGHDHPRNL